MEERREIGRKEESRLGSQGRDGWRLRQEGRRTGLASLSCSPGGRGQ